MSRENVEVVRRVVDGFNRRDFDDVLDAFHPEVEWHPYLTLVPGVRRGRAQVREFWQGMFDDFSDFELQSSRFTDLGDRVLMVTDFRAVGRQSGVETRLTLAQVHRFDGPVIVEVRTYRDAAEALEAVGLRE